MKWVGSVVPAPHGSRCRSSGGREKHYGAVELSEAGQQIYVNDVVEILPLKLEWDQEQQQQQQLDNFPEKGQPRLAQVRGKSFGVKVEKSSRVSRQDHANALYTGSCVLAEVGITDMVALCRSRPAIYFQSKAYVRSQLGYTFVALPFDTIY